MQIPGLDASKPEDAAKIDDARNQLKKVAKLELKLVHPQSDQLIAQMDAGTLPNERYAEVANYGLKIYKEERNGKTIERKLLVKKTPDVEGKNVTRAYAIFENRGYAISFSLDSAGAEQFAKVTEAHVGEQLAIVLDGEVQSAPNIQTAITNGSAVITGNFSDQEARNLASVLQNPLQTPVKILEERSASATLGSD